MTDIIMATTNHQLPVKLASNPLHSRIAGLFLDADLSVLGWTPTSEYDDYAWAIWQEYKFIGREKYCEGRPQVLERMLTQRDRLYFNEGVGAQLETQARANVNREIGLLKREL